MAQFPTKNSSSSECKVHSQTKIDSIVLHQYRLSFVYDMLLSNLELGELVESIWVACALLKLSHGADFPQCSECLRLASLLVILF